MAGNTVDEEIASVRFFNDMDFRLTNTSIENVNLTAFSTIYNDDEKQPLGGQLAGDSLRCLAAGQHELRETPDQPSAVTNCPAHRLSQATAGLKGVWRPWGTGFGLGGLAIIAGYEYDDFQRTTPLSLHGNQRRRAARVAARRTAHHHQWLPDRSRRPLVAPVRHLSALQVPECRPAPDRLRPGDNGQYNTLLPTDDNIVEVGCTLMPSDHFIVNASVGIEDGENHSSTPISASKTTPVNINAWYCVQSTFLGVGGLRHLLELRGPDHHLGRPESARKAPRGNGAIPSPAIWSYGGQSQVFTLGSRYQASERVRLTGKFEYVYGHDLISNSAIEVNRPIGAPAAPCSPPTWAASPRCKTAPPASHWAWIGPLRPRLVVFGRYEFVRIPRSGARLPERHGPGNHGRPFGDLLITMPLGVQGGCSTASAAKADAVAFLGQGQPRPRQRAEHSGVSARNAPLLACGSAARRKLRPDRLRLAAPQLLVTQLVALRAEPRTVDRQRFQDGNPAILAALLFVQAGVEAEDQQIVRQHARSQGMVAQHRFLLETEPLEQAQGGGLIGGHAGDDLGRPVVQGHLECQFQLAPRAIDSACQHRGCYESNWLCGGNRSRARKAKTAAAVAKPSPPGHRASFVSPIKPRTCVACCCKWEKVV